jgi:predicted metal-binding membrane protein
MRAVMMVPFANPVILLFAEINRRRNEHQGRFISTGRFLLGISWTGFRVLATLAQCSLLTAALVSPNTSKVLGGGLLLGAGLFQFSGLKNACLAVAGLLCSRFTKQIRRVRERIKSFQHHFPGGKPPPEASSSLLCRCPRRVWIFRSIYDDWWTRY